MLDAGTSIRHPKYLKFNVYYLLKSFIFSKGGMKMPKGFNPMQQVKALQDKMAKIQEELASKTVESSAGGGMVTAVANGRQELVSVKIDPQVVDPQDIDMLQDLIVAAINDALRKSQELAAGEMAKIAGGLNIPGLKIPGLF
jgi:DNA-binding YbaB/EbfC family protein